MARKKPAARKKKTRRKVGKSTPKKAARRKPVAKRKVARKKTAARARRKRTTKKPLRAKKRAGRKKHAGKKIVARSRPYAEEDNETQSADFDLMEPPTERGLGLESGGQSGDTEGLSRAEVADSESVEELLEEGQAFEAGIISGVEGAPDADEGEVTTRQIPEDDVPQEYLDEE